MVDHEAAANGLNPWLHVLCLGCWQRENAQACGRTCTRLMASLFLESQGSASGAEKKALFLATAAGTHCLGSCKDLGTCGGSLQCSSWQCHDGHHTCFMTTGRVCNAPMYRHRATRLESPVCGYSCA